MLGAVMMLGACKKKVAPPPPPPPPPPAAPTASFSASPDTIEKGQSTTLDLADHQRHRCQHRRHWRGAGERLAERDPSDSTTYHLVAKGTGGTQEATARVTVNAPPPPPPPQPSATEEELFSQNVKDIYFDYDKSDIRPDQQAAMQGDIDFLKQHPNISFTVEGHCDERGSTEYNLALGDSRANSVKNALVQGGVNAVEHQDHQLRQGKAVLHGDNEQCWQSEPARPLRLLEVGGLGADLKGSPQAFVPAQFTRRGEGLPRSAARG